MGVKNMKEHEKTEKIKPAAAKSPEKPKDTKHKPKK
jgi:hypothetical protein